jgi:hypothetical protein
LSLVCFFQTDANSPLPPSNQSQVQRRGARNILRIFFIDQYLSQRCTQQSHYRSK